MPVTGLLSDKYSQHSIVNFSNELVNGVLQEPKLITTNPLSGELRVPLDTSGMPISTDATKYVSLDAMRMSSEVVAKELESRFVEIRNKAEQELGLTEEAHQKAEHSRFQPLDFRRY